ncbi:hypothetical protein POX_h09636 [Penicillium oxalicum]|nr:hypothetical protein POX_h09636 [Penicillium oxalicum]KAI2785874.1 hypothetical protein POX_h09636 [Penicillium oxalicum]
MRLDSIGGLLPLGRHNGWIADKTVDRDSQAFDRACSLGHAG